MTAKIWNTFIILLVSGAMCVVANMVGYQGGLYDSILGTGIMIGIVMLGYTISLFPLCNKVYAMLWVSAFAILASSSIFPGHEFINSATAKVDFMAIATPLLAYAGLSIGKDFVMFKRLSWRIVPVALAVCAGTFLFAAIIAQFALKWEGAI